MQATTLGGKPPDVVQVGTPPTWQNGIAALMALKCAVCHVQPRPESAPTNVPGDLNLTQQDLQGVTRGAVDTVPAIQAGLLHHAISAAPNKMPLAFSTPMVQSEIDAMETWAGLQSAPPAGLGTPADGLAIYAYFCQGCHGVNGSGGISGANVGGKTAVDIQSAISGDVGQMASWPGLTNLAGDTNRLNALAAYLATVPAGG